MNKLIAFIKNYKTPLVLSLCLIFVITASFFAKKESVEEESPVKVEEARAFITKGNDSPVDKTPKKESIEVMPDERVIPEEKTTEASHSKAVEESSPSSVSLPVSENNSGENTFSLSMPIKGEISKAYSVSPVYSDVTGDWRSHEAIDIKSEPGSEVTSSERGTVVFVGKDPFSGITVRITHENGFESVYSNLHSETTVIEGQFVDKGHVIGYVGESSLIEHGEEPHLHFELFKNEKRVNPEEYIR